MADEYYDLLHEGEDIDNSIDGLQTHVQDSAIHVSVLDRENWNGKVSPQNVYLKTETDQLLSGKQNILTFDNVPTDSSSNPVKSGGVFSALAGKQDVISDLSSIRSGAASGATAVQPADMATALAAKLDTTTYNTEQAAVEAEIATVADAGAKNVLKTLRASGTSATGLIYTLNSDGTYSLGGVTTSDANISALCSLGDIPESYVGKTVKLTGAISGDIRLSVYNGNVQTEFTDNGDGVEFEVTSAMRTTPYTIRLLVRSGTDCSGKVIKPMLRLSSIKSDTFQPYAPTNRELYEMILAMQQ